MSKCEQCGKELADIQHGSGVAEDHPERGAEYPKWIEALGRVVHSKQEENEGLKPAEAPKTPTEGEAIKPLSEMLSTQQAPEASKPSAA